MLIIESCVPVEPKHLKYVLKLHCNLNAILARGLTIDLIVKTQMKCCAEQGTLLNWLSSLQKIKALVPAFMLCQWFEKLMKIVSLLYIFFFVFSPGMILPVGLVYIVKQWGEAAWWLVQRDGDELRCCNMAFITEYKVGSI